MQSLKEQQLEWEEHRARLEREFRVLVVDGDEGTRTQLSRLLYRSRIPGRAVANGERALQLVERERHSLVVTADALPGMRGIALTRQLRVAVPDVDVLLTTRAPTVDLVGQAFDLRLLDVWPKPFDEAEVSARLRRAVARHIDQRMRNHVLRRMRQTLQTLAPDARLRTTAALERRLSAFKSSLGAFDRVLVVEGQDADLRHLSESLLLASLHVETVENHQEALRRVAKRDLFAAVFPLKPDQSAVALFDELRRADPHLDLILVAREPTPEEALAALANGIAGYVPWPTAATTTLVLHMRDVLRRGKRDRLIDNLFLELYRETNRVFEPDEQAADFEIFRRLIGLTRVLTVEPTAEQERARPTDAVEYLEELQEMLVDLFEEPPELPAPPAAATPGSHERRNHPRVLESQFIRFRPRGKAASIMAFIGDLSEGGLFVRSPELLAPGTVVEVDFNVELEGRGFLVRCVAQVAWVARDERQSTMAPGFGVKFLEPPKDVVDLLRKIVAERVNEPPPIPREE